MVIRALVELGQRRPGLPVELEVYGQGDAQAGLQALVAELGVAGSVRFHGRIPLEAVPAAIAAADVGLAPTRINRFTEMSLSTKLFEYGAMDRPIVASALPLVERTFPAGSVSTYRPGDPADLGLAILRLVDDPEARLAGVALARARIAELAWDHEADRLMNLVDRLAGDAT